MLPAFVALVALVTCTAGALDVGTAAAADPVIAAAGDIACSSSSSNYNGGNGTADKCRQKYTSNLIVNAGLTTVLPLGDTQYESASLSGLKASYDPTWGRVKSITRPAAGNHEYKTTNAAGYFDYFNGVGVTSGPAGDRTKGYYSFDVGTWHLIALNSTDHCTLIPCGAGSAQETWLKADLVANASKYCTLAYWHDPRFNSGHDGNADEMAGLFKVLYDNNADVVLGGHAHDYERFAPQNPSGQLDNARGIRQFVVGTGGAFFTSLGTTKPNSQVRQNNTYGVLKLTLHPTGYDWVFVSESNKPFTDSGTGTCHGTSPPPTDTTKPTAPTNLGATAGSGQVSLTWGASSDNVGVTGYQVFRGTQQVATLGVTTSWTDTGLAPGPYSYTVKAVDAAGNVSDPSNTASTTVADTTKPTAPTGLTATPGNGQVALNWGASSDNVGVTGYQVLRGTQQVATLGVTTTWTDTGLSPGPYSYTVRAVDAAGNLSDPSNTASTTVADTTKPTAPGNLRATAGDGKVDLLWNASTDNVGVTGYKVYRGSQEIASLGIATAYTDAGLTPGPYTYTVRALDAAGNPSDPSNSATATVADTQKPTVPGNLRATAGAAKVDLLWNASTDNVAVTGYRVFRGTQQVAALGAVTSWSDTGLSPGPYSYTVKAIDAAGNLSDPSNTAGATVADTSKPSPPGGLTATGSAGQVDLAWSASSDDVGVTGYDVYRDGTPIASLGVATTYSDRGLAAGGYDYTVRARDAAGNVSLASNTAHGTVPDVQRPTAPANLNTKPKGTFQVRLTWDAASDNVGVTAYEIYRDNVLIDTIPPATSYTDNVLAPAIYTYKLKARDAAGNVSDPSNESTVTMLSPDTEAPTAPANLTANLGGPWQVDLAWDAASDNTLVTEYRVFRDGAEVGSTTTATSFSDEVAPGEYTYEVRAYDAAGNPSDPSNTASITVPDVDQPSAPGNLHGNAVGSNQVDLAWDASTDNVGVVGYEIYRDGVLHDTIAAWTSYTDYVLPATYEYEVRAFDAAGNRSDPSNAESVTVDPPDMEKPTAPGNLRAASTTSSKVDLSWDASSDNVGVTGYNIYRGGTEIASAITGTSYSDTNVAATQAYQYEVVATDAAGNVSDPSNKASVTVPDTVRPSIPANLRANTVGTNRIDLVWDAAGDNVAVTGYEVRREGTLIATVGAQTTYSDTPLGQGTYHYTVRALDGAGNFSDDSSSATGVVPDSTKPTAPGSLQATAPGPAQVDLGWQASTDDVGVTGYRVYRDTTAIATIGAVTTYSDTTAAAGTTYTYEVRALDAAGHLSDPSNSVTITTPAGSQQLTFAAEADARVQQANATTNYGLSNLRTAGDAGAAVESFLRFTVSGATGSVRSAKLRVFNYNGTVDGPAVYAAGNAWSETTVDWNTRPGRTSGATDDKGAITTNTWVEYDVTQFVTGNGTYSFNLAGPSTDGIDFRSREYATDRPELVVTTGAPDTQKPTVPANLTGAATSSNRVDLSWQAASDNVGVTGYTVYRDGGPIATIGATTAYSDLAVSASTPYRYEVRARDAAGNLSDPSNSFNVTTPAAAQVLTLSPEADARVDEGSPTTNYGTSYLRVNGGTDLDVETFLRFTVSGVPTGNVQSAKLRLYNYNGTVDGPAVYTTNATWSETAVNWNTRPARTSAATDDKGAIPVNSWIEYDVTPFVTGTGTYSFTLATTSSDGIDFYNREAATLRPELVVTLK